MRAELRRLLQSADDAVDAERPAGFAYDAALEEVRRLAPTIEAIVGQPLVIDEHVQDASFFTDLALQHAHGRFINTSLAVRFSSFGRLFSVWSVCESDEALAPDVIARVVEVGRAAGFVYVDANELSEPYDGVHPHVRGTWWIRFFDYL